MFENEITDKRNKKLKKKIIKYMSIVLIALLAIVAVIIGYRKLDDSDSKTTKIGYEDIGELATQEAYCTEVNVTESAKELWGVKLPFAQSKYIYSYDFVIKAGFDFGEIKWKEKNKKIVVTLPEVSVLSAEPVDDSFKVFHEQESIFMQIKLEENIEDIENMKQNAVENAIANGLYDNAKANAETILTGFFENVYDPDEYQIKFVYK